MTITATAMTETQNDEFIKRLNAVPGVRVRQDVPGATLTTFCIGGTLTRLVEVEPEESLNRVLMIVWESGIPFRVLGAGSNILISDSGVSEWVIRLGRGYREVLPLGGGRFEVAAAVSLMSLSRELSEQGYSGLEFAGGIPASVGGAVFMNAGAHGGQMSDVVESVLVATPHGKVEEIEASDLQYSYRHSVLPANAVIFKARIRLDQGDPVHCAKLRADFLSERKRRQPLSAPSAGSIFRNPSDGKSAGALIEKAGLKGSVRGGAKVSDLHANWIVNPRRTASSADVLNLMTLCQHEVQAQLGERLIPEVVVW